MGDPSRTRRTVVDEQRLADFQTLAGVGWWEWDAALKRPWWSAEMCRIYGRPDGFAPTQEEFRTLVHPDDRPDFDAQLGRGETGEFRHRILRPDGSVRHIHGRRGARRDANGELIQLYGTSQDVTDRRTAERERDEAREHFETAFSHAAVGMALVGLDGHWLRVNPAVCRITGYPEAELLALSFQDITHPDDLDADLALLQQLVGGEIPDYQMEKRYLTRDGGQIWVQLSVSLVRDEHGAPRHFISQLQDISDRRHSEAQVREAEAEAEARMQRDHAEAIIAAMHEGYALTVDGEVRAVNDAWCEMIGYARAELVGMRPPYPFWPPEHIRELNATRERIRTEGGGTFEATFARRDGTRFDAEITARPAYTAQGESIGFVNTLRDVSDRNRRQRELERRARTDSLTGLANRYVLEESLARESARGARDRTLALVLLDLDNFKQINEEHGHPIGDAVLVEVAERLVSVARAGEVLARVGGEEFAWLLPDCDAAGARAAADRARAVVAARPCSVVGRRTMSAGVGLARVPCHSGRLYELADRALYEAKQAGRDRTCCHQDADAADANPAAPPAGDQDARALAGSGWSATSPARPRGILETATTNASAIAPAMPIATVFVADAKSS